MISAQNLWQQVLQVAVDDALVGNSDSGASKAARIHATHLTRTYLTKPNQDFDDVCHLAGLDPVAVREAMSKKIAAAPTIEELFNSNRRRRATIERQLTFKGHTRTITQWCKHTGLTPVAINTRLKSGWTVERTLSEPSHKGKRRGVVSNFGSVLGTGVGTVAQDSMNIDFPKEAQTCP